MVVEIIDKNRKSYYKAVNGSMAFFTIIWSFLLIGYFIKNISEITVLDSIMDNLLLFSFIPFISGIVSAIILSFKEKRFVEFDESNKIKLILNMNEYDYKVDQIRLLPYSGNYLELENTDSRYEISADQVKEITAIYLNDKLEVDFQKQNTSVFIESPKTMFNKLTSLLWAMS